VTDEDHLIERRRPPLRVERRPHLGQVRTHLGRALPEGLARGVEVKPELIILADRGIATQVVEHLHPCDGARPQAVDHDDGDFVSAERLEHVETSVRLLGREEAGGGERVLVEGRLAEIVGQRRTEVGFQRYAGAVGVDVGAVERVVQLEHRVEGALLRRRRRRGERGSGGRDDGVVGLASRVGVDSQESSDRER
jgi:hypothetical protein